MKVSVILFCLFKYVNLSEKITSLNIEFTFQNIFLKKKNRFMQLQSKFNKIVTFFAEIASSQTGIVAGSVGGALVLVMTVLILGSVVHRRYTCICNIGNNLTTLQGFY